ncbi:MAG: type II and III secretion system protein [bacterium]|nr:MAG: type II and III secretion system protein [bacterium]
MALESLRGVENLIIREFPGGAILQGELLNPEDMRHVTLVADALGNVLNLCTLHPEALRYAASHLNTVLENNRISGVTLSVLGKGLLLTGVTLEQGDLDRIRRICEALHIPLVDGTRPSKADPRMVLFEVSFTEVNTDAFREIGVKWPASSPLADPSGMRIGRLSPAQNLEIVIEHLIHEGKARIISRPRLVCGSGRVASFQAGGEIPIPRSDEEGRLSVTWKPYGIILEVEPILDAEGLIHTGIRSEVSMVDQANAIEGIPGILTRRVETHLSLTLRQTVVLSGLVHSDDAERITKIPLLGDIPVLGELFRSRSFQKRETELVVFLTPMALGDNPLFENDRFPEHTINGPDEKTGAKDKRR